MKRMSLLILTIIIVAGTVLYLWSPWKVRQETVDFGNAGEVVKQARTKTQKIENYKYESDILVGEQIKVGVLTRVITGENRRQMVDFSWTIPKMSGMVSMYTEGKEIYIFHPLKNKWLLPREEPTLSPFLDFFWRQLSLIDPVDNLLDLDPNATNMSIKQDDKNRETVVIEVIPRPGALPKITDALPPQFSGAELKNIKQLFWISRKDLTVTRYEVEAKAVFFAVKTMDFKVISKPMNYNNTTIKIPNALQDKMKKAKG